MVAYITDKKDYIKDINLKECIGIKTIPSKIINVLGHKIELYDDKWMWHVHIKLTNACNARCHFCVEKGDNTIDDPQKLFKNMDLLIMELKRNNSLYSVSITGGEPTIYPYFETICHKLKSYEIPFLTMNTNGTLVEKYLSLIDDTFDYINISRHSIDDSTNNQIFKKRMPTLKDLQRIRSGMNKCKMRIQAVLTDKSSPCLLESMIKAYSFADDLSIRRLMELENQGYEIDKDGYRNILDYCLENYSFKEQVIQDYYVYETYNTGRTDITFSYSNMKLLLKQERIENPNLVREFVIHPDGVVSKSWKKQSVIIE